MNEFETMETMETRVKKSEHRKIAHMTLAQFRKEMREGFERACSEEIASFTPDAIVKETLRILNKDREDIIFKMLGFRNDFNQKEIDHCNGRMSAVTELLQAHAKEGVARFLAQFNSEEIFSPAEIKQMLNAMKREYQHQFKSEVRNALWEKVRTSAKETAGKIAKELQDELLKEDAP